MNPYTVTIHFKTNAQTRDHAKMIGTFMLAGKGVREGGNSVLGQYQGVEVLEGEESVYE